MVESAFSGKESIRKVTQTMKNGELAFLLVSLAGIAGYILGIWLGSFFGYLFAIAAATGCIVSAIAGSK